VVVDDDDDTMTLGLLVFTQVLIGLNLLLGLSNHLRNAVSASDPFGGPSLPSLPLACAQANPR
jgi:hypothetical protein